ncbi:MAG: GNAT family N-acetyltransferase [Betaproteobacteria bacterium]|nr:GNAT family N-acetyltransferase [Betaproteobacteria bacterium]
MRHQHVAQLPTREAKVTLREITRETVREVALLDVSESQIGLVAPNAFSIAQAHFSPEAWFRAIYAGDVPVGFAMMEDWSQVTDRAPELYDGEPYVALWRFMIDQRFQGLGFGSKALALLIDVAKSKTYASTMVLSFVPEGPNAEPFYARHGFVNTGVVDEGEVVMKLDLRRLRAA